MNTDKTALPIEKLGEMLLDEREGTKSNQSTGPGRFIRWAQGLNWLFIFIVLVPTLFSAIYYGLIASNVYVSESCFVVESIRGQSAVGSGIAAMLSSALSNSTDQDTANVTEYMLSRDALRQVDAEAGIRDAYSNSSVDRLARFGGLSTNSSFEELYRYYTKHIVSVHPSDNSSSMATSVNQLEVTAFSPEEAYTINQKLLDGGERLLNSINERLQADLVRYAQAEVAANEKKAEAAYVALANYRNANKLVDPEHQSSLQLDLGIKLQENLIETENQLAQLSMSSANNPQIPTLRDRIKNLQAEIATEKSKASGDTTSLTNQASEYERLVFERDFSQNELSNALQFLTESRNQAQQKQLYLKRVVEPNLPDYPLYPKRIRNVVGSLILGLLFWGVVSLFVAGVREHQR